MNMKKKEIKISVEDFNEILNKSQGDAIKNMEDVIRESDKTKEDSRQLAVFSMQNMLAMIEFEKELKKNLKISEE